MANSPQKVEALVDTIMEKASGGVSNMAGAELELTRSMLHTWCWLTVQINELEEQVNKEGALIPDEKKGYREHPAIQTIHKLTQRKSDYYTKLMRRLNLDEKDLDGIARFMK